MGQSNHIKGSIEKSAAPLIEEAAKSGVQAHHLAQRKIEECQAAGDPACMQFWRNVWIHIMSYKYPPENSRDEKLLDYNSDEIIL
jgi:hypothetical protein